MKDFEIMWFLWLILKILIAILIGLYLYENHLDKKFWIQKQILLDLENKKENKK